MHAAGTMEGRSSRRLAGHPPLSLYVIWGPLPGVPQGRLTWAPLQYGGLRVFSLLSWCSGLQGKWYITQDSSSVSLWLDLGVMQLPFCHILLATSELPAFPHSRGGDSDSNSSWGCGKLLEDQRYWYCPFFGKCYLPYHHGICETYRIWTWLNYIFFDLFVICCFFPISTHLENKIHGGKDLFDMVRLCIPSACLIGGT